MAITSNGLRILMFQRREPISIWKRTKDFFWPSIGWKRSFLYVRHRLVRLSDSSHKIALGLAIGVAVSFSPIVGTHFVQAAGIAYLLRGNLLSSIVGTFIGNPWTFPFIWWLSISFGSFLFQLFGFPAETSLPDHMTLSILWEIVKTDPMRLFIPWMVGGYIAALISFPFAYYIFFRVIQTAKKARRKARVRKLHKIAKEVTGQKV